LTLHNRFRIRCGKDIFTEGEVAVLREGGNQRLKPTLEDRVVTGVRFWRPGCTERLAESIVVRFRRLVSQSG
jgi:hypothetical protein